MCFLCYLYYKIFHTQNQTQGSLGDVLMINERKEKNVSIALIMDKYNYEINETINRRIKNYDFQANTTIRYNNEYIRISTETKIKGVHHILIIFSNGTSKLDFEFDFSK